MTENFPDPRKTMMELAANLAFQCPPSDKAYAVGAVIASPEGAVIATGFSREWGNGWHAEEIAIEKARQAGAALKGATIYATLEPCHPRLSGKTSCTDHIIGAGIARVVFCLREPPLFTRCRSEEKLKDAGIEAVQDDSCAGLVRAANRTLAGAFD